MQEEKKMEDDLLNNILIARDRLEEVKNKMMKLSKKEISKEKNLFIFENYKLISDSIIRAANINFN